MTAVRRAVLAAALALAACTPNVTATRVKYDGAVAAALATLAKDCVPIGVAEREPLATASDFRCTSDDAEVVIHLDRARTLRGVNIRMLAATTDEARVRLEEALDPVLDDHHRKHALEHLDDPVPGGVTPIQQLALEDFLYQIASEPVGGDDVRRRYIVRIRID